MSVQHKYLEIKQYILDNIESGVYLVGEKIESETTLRDKFNVSRMTVRQAINELQNENILETIKGKGTFVLSEDVIANGAFLMSFSERANAHNKICTNKVINFSQSFSDSYQNNVFSFSKSKPIWNICRIRYINNLPAAYEESFIPVDYLPSMTIENVENSLFECLDQNNVSVSYAKQKNVAVMPNNVICEYLELSGGPIIKSIERCFDAQNRCVELCYSYYHPTNYHNTRTIMRKKLTKKKEVLNTKVLLVSDQGIVTSSLEYSLNVYIQKNKLTISLSCVDFRRIDDHISNYEIILIEPKYRYAYQELHSRYPKLKIHVIDMQDYAIQDAEKIIEIIKKDLEE